MAGIFRSVRFGASSAHGKANMIRFNFFRRAGAFERQKDGKYRVNADAFCKATRDLSALLLTPQGDGDDSSVAELIRTDGVTDEQWMALLELLF